MGTSNKWDVATYQMYKIRTMQLHEKCQKIFLAMNTSYGNESFSCRGRSYDPEGEIAKQIARFGAATARLNELCTAMDSYWNEYNGMLESSQGTMEAVQVGSEVYGSFEGLVAGSAAAIAYAYSGSVAYQFHQQGYSFSEDFNDAADFIENDSTFSDFEVLTAISNIRDWETLTLQVIASHGGSSPTEYSDKLMENALLSSLSMVPAYDSGKDFDLSAVLAKILGSEDLEAQFQDMVKLLEKMEKAGVSDELVSQLQKLVNSILKGLGFKSSTVEVFLEFVEDTQFLTNFCCLIAKTGATITEIGEFFFGSLYFQMENHEHQIAYLDSVQEALAMGGHVGGTLQDTLDEIKAEFINSERQFLNGMLDGCYDQLEGVTASGVNTVISEIIKLALSDGMPSIYSVAGEINLLGQANLFYDIVGISADLLAGDQIEAVETLLGLQTYTGPLIDSYEKYMSMIDAGVATVEDIQAADNLFQLIRASKIKEYECIQTISIYGSTYDLAGEKIEQLEQLGTLNTGEWWKHEGFEENPLMSGRTDGTK